MIDHLTLVVDVDHPPINPQPKMQDGQLVSYWSKNKLVPVGHGGAWIQTADQAIHPARTASRLKVSWNPVMCMQGHNLFGTRNLQALLSLLPHLLAQIGITMDDDELERVSAGDIEVREIHLNFPINFETCPDADQWLRSVLFSATRKGKPASRSLDNGVYWGRFTKDSHYKEVNLYNKHRQMCRKMKAMPVGVREKLLAEAEGMIRFEVRYGRDWLDRDAKGRGRMDRASAWFDRRVIKDLLTMEFVQLRLLPNTPLGPQRVLDLPSYLRPVYEVWNLGGPTAWVRAYPAEGTRKRHRQQMLKYEIDLKLDPRLEPPPRPVDNLVDLDAMVPAWAIGTELYFDGHLARPGPLNAPVPHLG